MTPPHLASRSCRRCPARILAGTYRRTASAGESVDAAIADADLAQVLEHEYVILPDLLSAGQVGAIRDAAAALLGRHGRNARSKAATPSGSTAC